jgi:hypothetical protein
VAGGGVYLYIWLLGRARRPSILLGLGTAAVILSIASGYMLLLAIQMALLPGWRVPPLYVLLMLFALKSLLWAVLAALFWYEFYHVLRMGKTRFLRFLH